MLLKCSIGPVFCEGELLALTPDDFDFEKRTVTINKSFQHLNGRDIITSPKTEKSNRTIQLPKFLCDEMQDYLKRLYDVGLDDECSLLQKAIYTEKWNEVPNKLGGNESAYTIFVIVTLVY